MSILLLPSLERDDATISIDNISKAEAEEFLANFDARVTKSRRLGANPEAVPHAMEFFSGSLDIAGLIADEEIDPLIETLGLSKLHAKRGRRAVYIDPDNNEVGVGTTVIYNRNWAMRGVEDASVAPYLLTLVAEDADA